MAWVTLIYAVEATRRNRPPIPLIPYTPNWWDDRAMRIVEALFGWKDRVYQIVAIFVDSRFVFTSNTPPQDDNSDDAKSSPPAKKGKDMGSSLKSSVKKAVVEAVYEARLANSPDDDVRLLSDLTTKIASLHDKASNQVQKAVNLYDLGSVARSTLQVTVQIIRDNSPRMLTPDERSRLAEQTICDWIRGVSHRPHCLFPALHALKVASGHTRGLGLNLGGEFITMTLRRTSILIYKGEDVAKTLLEWLRCVWVPWRSHVSSNPVDHVATVLLAQIEPPRSSAYSFVETSTNSWASKREWIERWEVLRRHLNQQLGEATPCATTAPANVAPALATASSSTANLEEPSPETTLDPPPFKRAKKAAPPSRRPDSGRIDTRFDHLGPLVAKVLFNVECFGANGFVPHGEWRSDGQTVRLLGYNVAKATPNKLSLLLRVPLCADTPAPAATRDPQSIAETFEHVTSSGTVAFDPTYDCIAWSSLLATPNELVKWVSASTLVPLPKVRGGMPRLERVENAGEKVLKLLYSHGKGEDWAGPDRIGTRYTTDEALRQIVQDGANDSIIIGIDLGTKCPMAVSATLFDRNEVQIQDDVVVYADALDKPLRKVQSHVRKLSAELAGSLRFGHAKPPGHAATPLEGQRPATSAATLDGPASAPSDSNTTERDDADARTRAELARGSSSRLLLGEPDRQAWAAKTNLLSKASRRRFVEQVMEVSGLRTIERARDDTLKQADLGKIKTAEVLQRKDILSPRQRPVLVFVGEGGSSRGTQKATYRTNVLCRDLVQEFNRLKERGFVVEIVSVDEYNTSSVCSDPTCRNEVTGERSR
ncbi:BZ3500_MvSof-1268-A1-R1_Chr7-3g09606 [Microbotryum saponariae]|uniref:BZ3500_MvSof-1268-A1-R1_Chr7-3g09606 protein n=1 Tax=Microbotryum saponariae TaxID=289078 RepID=A0A2X0LSN6_9BASI|nr:BZ3501_MvSof-1269-A2-R1_Chr7-2g09329 [Microbotryum saponariae]SDA02273.1 BZ3500_MvSof-1268-A1-R1_Chr7-3g09606 [Microbotryum saponariae]